MDELSDYVGNLQLCPWSDWKQASLRFCEAPICDWIVAPAETWSNLAYLLVALYLIYTNLEKNLRSVEIRFGIYAMIVGVFSGLYHASHTFIFETLDLASMQFLGTELVVLNLIRLGWLRGKSPMPFAGLLFFGGVGMLLGMEGEARLNVFTAYVTVSVFFEILLFVRAKRLAGGLTEELKARYKPYLATILIFLVAFGAWILDEKRILCQPRNHFISGHAVWHVLNSMCFLTLSRFYRYAKTR